MKKRFEYNVALIDRIIVFNKFVFEQTRNIRQINIEWKKRLIHWTIEKIRFVNFVFFLLKRFDILELTNEFRRVISYQIFVLLSNWFKNYRIIVWVIDSKMSRRNSQSKLFQIIIIWLKTNFISTILTYLKMFWT